MEDNHHYDMSDLRHFVTRPRVASFQQQQQQQQQPFLLSELMTAHHNHRHHIYNDDSVPVMGRHVGNTTTAITTAACNNNIGGGVHQYSGQLLRSDPATTVQLGVDNCGGLDAGDVGTARWPRQETLTLLEIRGRLDYKFKGAIHKAPLWDELARIMCEEYGYQRNGKKCKEKFENLYKYYKKTKEGKAGRQDGKHYRFFRQLEALYGDNHQPPSTSSVGYMTENNIPQFYPEQTFQPLSVDTTHNQQNAFLVRPPRVSDPGSLSNSSNLNTPMTSSSYDGINSGSNESNESMGGKKRKGKKSWKTKTKEFIDLQMKKIEEKQEMWLEKMMKTIDSRENERMVWKEEWRNQEANRVEKEHKFWANERAWIEGRDSVLMSTIEKLTNNNNNNNNNNGGHHQWQEHEVTRLIYVRIGMESRFQQCGFLEQVLWEDIASKMANFGYNKSAIECKKKWDSINKCFQEKGMTNKDHHNNSNNGVINEGVINYVNHHHQSSGGFNNCEMMNEPKLLQLNEISSTSQSSHNSNANVDVNVVVGGGNVMNDNSCLRFFLGDNGETSLGWESNYGHKLNKGDNQVLH